MAHDAGLSEEEVRVAQPQRVDARRNFDRLLEVAAQSFADHGTEASLRDIARQAGVGIGTLYRHFPTRDDLLEALLHTRFDRLRDLADGLLAAAEPFDALARWLGELVAGTGTYRGLPEAVLAALRDEQSQLHMSCEAMRAAGNRLLQRAQSAGTVRDDIVIGEVLALAAGLAWAGRNTAQPGDVAAKLLSVTLDGLRVPGAAR
jgi:AcrR family transcriptional regulator